MKQKETWKNIKGYEGYYKISNLGRVKSLQRNSLCKSGSVRLIKEKILKQNINTSGYYHVTLYKEGKPSQKQIHTLMAKTFLNHKPKGTSILVCDHINNIKTDNSLSNLRLISHRRNVLKSLNKSNTTSKYIGVHYSKSKSKWISKIKIKGKSIHLGVFNNEEKAHEAYLGALSSI